MHLHRRSTVSARTALVISLLACALPRAADAANRPDLSVSGLQVLTHSVLQRGHVRLYVVLRNAGKPGPRPSAVALCVSTAKRKSKSDKVLGGQGKVKSLP